MRLRVFVTAQAYALEYMCVYLAITWCVLKLKDTNRQHGIYSHSFVYLCAFSHTFENVGFEGVPMETVPLCIEFATCSTIHFNLLSGASVHPVPGPGEFLFVPNRGLPARPRPRSSQLPVRAPRLIPTYCNANPPFCPATNAVPRSFPPRSQPCA